MGLLDRLGLTRKRIDTLSTPTSLGIVSQYADHTTLGGIVISEALGATLANLPLGEEEALTIPAVTDALGLLTSTIARFPLVVLDANNVPIKQQPAWCSRSDADTDPHERMTQTVQDIALHGNAVWLTTRGSDGFVLDAAYCPRDQWSEKDGQLYITGRDTPLASTEYIVFNPPAHRGLLNVGARNLRGAIDVERSWLRQARNPIPLMVLQVTDDSNLDQDEIDAYVSAFSKARNSANGAVGFLPPGIEMQVYGESDPALMTTGRNASKNDVSSFLGIPTSLLDGTVNEASLNYTTTEGNRNRFYDQSVPRWTDPIAYRLSRDDIVPRTQHVAFDMYSAFSITPPATGPTLQD